MKSDKVAGQSVFLQQKIVYRGALRILSLETSTPSHSIALHQNGNLLEELIENVNRKSSHLILNIQTLLLRCKWKLEDIDGFAYSGGPGSLTGLRVGAMAVFGLAIATGKPMVKISTLKAMALSQRKEGNDEWVAVVVDAHHLQVHLGLYRVASSGNIETIIHSRVCSPDQALRLIPDEATIIGDGVSKYRSLFLTKFPGSCHSAADTLPLAQHIGYLAHQEFSNHGGIFPSAENWIQLEPNYGQPWKGLAQKVI